MVDSSDDEEKDIPTETQGDEDEEEYTPAPARTPRGQSRKRTSRVGTQTPRTARRTRGTIEDSIKPPEGASYMDISTQLESEQRRVSPRKRKSVMGDRSKLSTISQAPTALLTPKPSVTPEPEVPAASPLADITRNSVNIRSPIAEVAEEAMLDKVPQPMLEKPMDIVIRSRAMAPSQQPAPPAAPTTRIVLTYLVLTNFKSYAGRQEVGPFHSSFSSVVGPNGSGKSNVIDSLLFVFGFRASKMRQGKISALIHNSAAFPNLDHCEVEVHFREIMDLVSSPSP